MNVVVLTRNPRGIASRFLARRSVEVVGVLLDEGTVTDRRAHLRAKARKLRRIGPTALPVGLALRRAYAAAAGDVPALGELDVTVTRVPTLNGEEARDALRRLGADDAAPQRLDLARRLLRQLPATNWFKRNPFVGDHIKTGDAGLYDLLLHSQDRAYTVPEFAALVSGAGLEIAAFIEPWRYEPASYVNDGLLLKKLSPPDRLARAEMAELLAGNLKVHIAYVVKRGRAATAVARADDPTLIPVLRDDDGPTLARNSKPGGALTAHAEGLDIRFPLPARAGPILARIDGRRTLQDIHRELAADIGRLDWGAFKDEFDRLFTVFNGVNKMFLQSRS